MFWLIAGCVLLGLLAALAVDTVSASFQTVFNQGQDVVQATVPVTGTEKVYAQVNVAAGATVNYLATGDPDAVDGYLLLPTFSGTLTTTNSSGGADVVALTANVPLFWHNQMGLSDAGRFANRNPWTNWAIHNTGATDGTFTVLIIRSA